MNRTVSLSAVAASLMLIISPLTAGERIEGYGDMKLGMHLLEFIEYHPGFRSHSVDELAKAKLSAEYYPQTDEERDYLGTHHQTLELKQEARPQEVTVSFVDSILVSIEARISEPEPEVFWALRDSLKNQHGEWKGTWEDELAYVWYEVDVEDGEIRGYLRLSRECPPDVLLQYEAADLVPNRSIRIGYLRLISKRRPGGG